MDFLTSFDRPFKFYTLTLNADKTHGNGQLSKLDFWKNNLSKTRMPHTQLSFWWKYIYHKKRSWVWGILKINFDAFVKRTKMPFAKTRKNSGKVKMDRSKVAFSLDTFEFEHQNSTNVSRSVRKLADPYGTFLL